MHCQSIQHIWSPYHKCESMSLVNRAAEALEAQAVEQQEVSNELDIHTGIHVCTIDELVWLLCVAAEILCSHLVNLKSLRASIREMALRYQDTQKISHARKHGSRQASSTLKDQYLKNDRPDRKLAYVRVAALQTAQLMSIRRTPRQLLVRAMIVPQSGCSIESCRPGQDGCDVDRLGDGLSSQIKPDSR